MSFGSHGVSSEGFSRPHIDEIRDYWIREATQRFGRTITGPSSAELQFVEMLALASDTFWETLQQLYYSGYFPYAEDLQLDNVLALAGVGRLPRREATGEVTFFASRTGGATEPITIQRGTRLTTEPSGGKTPIPFVTTEPAVIERGETAVERVSIRALGPLETDELTAPELGEATNVPENTITRIATPIGGVGDPTGDTQGVTNPHPTGTSGEEELPDGSTRVYDYVTGRNREEDFEYRLRYENSLALSGKATLAAIESGIRNAGDGRVVRSVDVSETLPITQEPDGTFTGRYVEPIVLLSEDTPGNREAVSQAILDNRAAGIQSVGDIQVAGERADGSSYATGLGYSLASEVPVYISAEVVRLDDFPSDGVERMKTNILSYIGGTTPGGVTIDGAGIGDDIYRSRVAGCIADNDMPGIREITGNVSLDTVSPPGENEQISIADDQVARTTFDMIDITTVYGQVE